MVIAHYPYMSYPQIWTDAVSSFMPFIALFHWGKAGINENYDSKKDNTVDDWNVNPLSEL